MKVIDWGKALEQVEGDEDFLMEMLQLLLIEATQAEKDIQSGIRNSDFDKVMHAAHKIKGSAANLACDELRDISLQLQELGRNGMNGVGSSSQLWSDINRKFPQWVGALESLRKESSSRK